MKFILVLAGIGLSWTAFSLVFQKLSGEEALLGCIAYAFLTLLSLTLIITSAHSADGSSLIDVIAVPLSAGWVFVLVIAVLNIALQMRFGLPT